MNLVNDFPLEVFNPVLQDIAKDYVRIYESNLNAVCGVMLAAMAFPLNNYYQIQVSSSHIVRPNLWFMYIAYPSVGKTPLINTMINSISKKDQELMKDYNKKIAEYLSYNQAKKDYKNDPDSLQSYINLNCNGITPTEPRKLNILLHQSTTEALNKAMNIKENDGRSLMFFADEILGVYKSFGKYSNGFSSGEEEFNRMFNYVGENTGRVGGDVNVGEKNVNIIATTQPDISYEVINKNRIGNGNAFRWLYFLDEDLKLDKNNIRSIIDVDCNYNPLDKFNEMISYYLMDYSQDINRTTLKLDRESMLLIADCVDEWNKKAMNNEFDIDAITFKSITGKMTDYIFKFCIVLNRSNNYYNKINGSIHITSEDVKNAIKLANYYILNSIKVLNKVTNSSGKYFKGEEEEFYNNLKGSFSGTEFIQMFVEKNLGSYKTGQRLLKKWSGKDLKLFAMNSKNNYYKLPI